MKGKSISLKEAHKPNINEEEAAAAGTACILWDWHAKHIITAGSDTKILIHDFPISSSTPLSLTHHKNSVSAIAISASAKLLASASLDHSVKLYSYPGGEFQSNVTRFSLPIRSLAFNRSGQILAAAGDDDGIKLISTIDNSISRVLKGHNGSVICLAFDPKNEFLASVDSQGTVVFWELSSGKALHTLKKMAPESRSDLGLLNEIGWSPDGEMLAVPGRKGEVIMYDRDTAEKVFSLKGGHSDVVCALSWSPNGKYVVTSGLDRQILVWDAGKKQDIERLKVESAVCSMAWKPTENALAVIDVLGCFGVWMGPVPGHMVSPTEGFAGFQDNKDFEEGFMGMYEEDAASADGSLDGIELESSDDEMYNIPLRLRKKKVPEVEDDEAGSKAKDGVVSRNVCRAKSVMQEAFQPGSTPFQPGKRNFLAYNLVGCVITFENEGCSHVEVEFHDIGRGCRVPSMSDYFGFTMASLNEHGAVFASPQKGEKNPSILMYRPFSSWANNSEWSMRFQLGEEVKAVSLGSGWIAAATSLNFLRIFSEGGLQKFVLSLDGPVVSAVGHENLLFVVYHSSAPLPSGEQVLSFALFNIPGKTRTLSGRLPIGPSSHLAWIGFSEEGLLSSYDSEGTLRIFTNEYTGCWVPVLSKHTISDKQLGAENYWMVGLNNSQAFCVVCKSPETYPQVAPKPILSVFDLKLPLACSDLGADDLENTYIRGTLLLSQLQKKIEDAVAQGKDCSAEEDSIDKMEGTLDGHLLRLIANCCKGDKLVRAVELAKQLSFDKSLRASIKLATASRLPILAERLNSILEEKIIQDDMEVIACMNSMSAGDSMNYHSMDANEAPTKADCATKTSLSSTFNSSCEASVLARPDCATGQNCVNKAKAVTPASHNGNGKKESSDTQNGSSTPKPSNPFAKSASAKQNVQQNGGSLLNSIKKMKDDASENQAKRKDRPPFQASLPQRAAKQSKKS